MTDYQLSRISAEINEIHTVHPIINFNHIIIQICSLDQPYCIKN